MATIVWSEEAAEDLRIIREYISRDNPLVADRIVDDLVRSAVRLRSYPMSGWVVEELRAEEVREIIAAPYHVAYRVLGDVVQILKVWHGKRMLRPAEFSL